MKRILIAEDNDSNYMLMTYIVKKQYEYYRARDGREAVELVKQDKPDMVLMDLKMPIQNGLDATREIKALYPDLPVIAVTANAFDSDRIQAVEAGCDDFLAKPVSTDKCLQVIAKYI